MLVDSFVKYKISDVLTFYKATAGSFNQLINGVLNNSDKMQSLQNFFEGVGSDDTSGVWENEPNVRPEFRAQNQKKLEKAARAAKAQEMI